MIPRKTKTKQLWLSTDQKWKTASICRNWKLSISNYSKRRLGLSLLIQRRNNWWKMGINLLLIIISMWKVWVIVMIPVDGCRILLKMEMRTRNKSWLNNSLPILLISCKTNIRIILLLRFMSILRIGRPFSNKLSNHSHL